MSTVARRGSGIPSHQPGRSSDRAGIYLGKQLHDALVGSERGEGFFFTLTVADLDLESGTFAVRDISHARRESDVDGGPLGRATRVGAVRR